MTGANFILLWLVCRSWGGLDLRILLMAMCSHVHVIKSLLPH
jgi:hypothetical protein